MRQADKNLVLPIRFAALALLSFLLLFGSATRAKAAIYWNEESQIGRVNLDGSSLEPDFILLPKNDESTYFHCGGVAVDGSHIYWAQPGRHAIGRANLDGTNPDFSLISNAGEPCGVAVDDSHIYWADHSGTTIGRANLDGTSPNLDFISGEFIPDAVERFGAYVYWVSVESWLNRANLDGTGLVQPFISDPGAGQGGFAVNSSYIYWADLDNGIGRANLDGSDFRPDFISGLERPCDVAIDGSHLYWSRTTFAHAGAIGRANLDGTAVEPSFVTGVNPCGLAVDDVRFQPAPLPPTYFSFAKVKHGKHGPVTLFSVDVAQPGSFSLRVPRAVGWNRVTEGLPDKRFSAPGRQWFAVWPKQSRAGNQLSKAIRNKGGRQISVWFSYTGYGQAETTKQKKLTIRRGSKAGVRSAGASAARAR